MYQFELRSPNGQKLSVHLTADQISKIEAIPYDHLTVSEIVVAGITALGYTARQRKNNKDGVVSLAIGDEVTDCPYLEDVTGRRYVTRIGDGAKVYDKPKPDAFTQAYDAAKGEQARAE